MATDWMIREDQLDTDQLEFVNNRVKRPGNIWVQGFAGSGKSVLLIHSMLDTLRKEPRAINRNMSGTQYPAIIPC
ncbi:hypothetical protein [Mariniphaga sp.]|uniref:hypothetical protein n=1 Tax=Mariniphaga sp. TaxID=1954475 RepID=UPI00356A381C